MSDKIEEKTEDRIFGSYLFVNYANKGKIEKVKDVLKEYRKTVKERLVNNFVSGLKTFY